MATQVPLSPDNKALLTKIVEELDHGDRRLFDSLSEHEKNIVLELVNDFIKGDSSKIDTLWEIDYVRKPVAIQTFLDDPDYFRTISESLFPLWRRDLERIFAPKSNIFEVIVTGAIGTGKTTAMFLGLAYKIYLLTCLRNPARFYGLMEGPTQFVFGLFNATLALSEEAHYGKVIGMLTSSPYFRWLISGSTDKLKRDNSVLDMPNSIHITFGSQALHALGQDMIGVLLDEMNFRDRSLETQSALEVYKATKRRIQSRFPARPGVGRKSPGVLFLISSRKGESDFLDKHIQDTGGMDGVIVLSYSEWEMKKHLPGKYSGINFRVMKGDERVKSRVLDKCTVKDDEWTVEKVAEAPEKYQVVDVPVEHYNDFILDPDGALMDIAGIPVKGAGHSLLNREKVYYCHQNSEIYYPGRKHPFTVEEVPLGLASPSVIEDFLTIEDLAICIDPYTHKYRPKINPLAERFIHLDPATSGACNYGFTMGHVARIKNDIIRRDLHTGVLNQVSSPVICLDIMLRITHDPGDEIDLSKVRQFILFLVNLGFPIRWITSDQFQSVDTLQIFTKMGYNTKRISLDGDPQNYIFFKQAIHEDRVLTYEYPPFLDEAINIQTNTKGQVFPIMGKFKDLLDSACGVVANIMTQPEMEQSAPAPMTVAEIGTVLPKALQDPEEELVKDIVDEIDDIESITDIR